MLPAALCSHHSARALLKPCWCGLPELVDRQQALSWSDSREVKSPCTSAHTAGQAGPLPHVFTLSLLSMPQTVTELKQSP